MRKAIGRARWLPCTLVISLSAASDFTTPSAVAAQANRYDHSAAVERLLKQMGGIDQVGGASPRQVAELAQHLMARGQLLLDVYDYHRVVSRDYALLRDSIADHGGRRVPGTRYFLARSLHELGDAEGALKVYRTTGEGGTPPEFQRLASAWAATIRPGSNGSGRWQRQLAEWRSGKPLPAAVSCPDGGGPACRLFRALVVDDPVALSRAQRRLMNDPQPDYVHEKTGAGGALRIEFYDPLQLFLLAATDFSLAAHVTAQIDRGAELAQGVALLRIGRFAEAEAALNAASAAGGTARDWATVYRAELAYRRGQRAAAAELWRSVAETGSGPALAGLEARSGLDPSARGLVLQQFQLRQQQGLEELRGKPEGTYLGRALLREGYPEEALKVLEVVRRPSWGSDLDRVQPELLVLLSRARYESGRDHYALARGDLALLSDPFPVIRPLLMMLQEITAPSHVPNVRSGG